MKTKKIVIIAIVAILVVLGGTFAGLWFFTDIFKPKQETVAKEATDIEKALNLEGARFSNYSEFLKQYKEVSAKSSKSKFDVTANLKISSLDSNIQNIINKSKISLESNTDVKNNRAQSKIGLYSDNSEVLSLDLVTNDTSVGIGCEDLYDKYISVSLEDLLQYFEENYGDEFDTDSLQSVIDNMSGENSIDPYEILYISDEDLQHFDEAYRDGYKALIPADNYSSKDKVEVTVNGNKISTKAYYLTLTGKDCYNLIKGLGDTLKNDSVLSRLVSEKLNLILKSSGQASISESDVKDFITEMVDSLDESLEDIKDMEDSAVQIAVYSKDDKLVKFDFNLIEDTENLDDTETILSYQTSDSKKEFIFYEDGEEYIVIKNNITEDSDEEKSGDFTISVQGSSVATIDYDFVNKENEKIIDLSLNVPLLSLKAGVNFEFNGNYNNGPVDIKGSINYSYGKDSAQINFDGTMEYADDVSVTELNSSNSVDILSLSETELQTEMEKILEKASNVLPDRLKLIGINVTKEDFYQNSNNDESTSTPDLDSSNEVTENTEDATNDAA